MRILAVDGGGIRGVIPATVLAELERRTARPLCRLFDYFVGTSTGGIIALAAVCPDEHGEPRYSAAQMVDFYREHGPRIFPPHHFSTALQIVEEKYSSAGLDEALSATFGEYRLSQAVRDVMVTCYDVEQCEPVFLRRSLALAEPGLDLPMRLAARATAAAPTYFAPLTYQSGERAHVFVDGGLVANNPVMAALAHGHESGADLGQVVAVSLGSGQIMHRGDYEHPQHRGIVQWASRLFTMVMDGTSAAVDHHAATLLDPRRYHRFNTPLVNASAHLDDAHPDNIEALAKDARTLIERDSARLDLVAELLVSGGDERGAAAATPSPGG